MSPCLAHAFTAASYYTPRTRNNLQKDRTSAADTLIFTEIPVQIAVILFVVDFVHDVGVVFYVAHVFHVRETFDLSGTSC